MTAIVIGMEAAGRTRQGIAPAQPCATRDSAQINPTCVSGKTHPHGIAGVRELVTVRIRVGSGRAHRCIYPVLETPQLARIQFQSAAARFRSVIPAELLPSGRWTAGSVLPVWRCFRPFQFVPIVKAIGSLIPSLRVQPAKQSRGGFSKCLRSFSCAVFHDRNTTTGLRAWRAEKLSLSSRNWGMRS